MVDVVLQGGHFGVLGAEEVSLDAEDLLVGVLSLLVVPTGRVQGGEVVLDDGDLVVVLAKPVLPDRERLQQDLFGFGVSTLAEEERAEYAEVGSHAGRSGLFGSCSEFQS